MRLAEEDDCSMKRFDTQMSRMFVPCGEDNHCNINIDTHEHVNSDSEEEEHIETK